PKPHLSAAELGYIRGDAPEPGTAHIPWLRLLAQRQTWAVVVGKFMTDPIWWFYLYWLPKFLDPDYGIKLSQLALPLVVVYVVADAGSVAGGWLSGALMQRGWTVNRARKTALLCMALAIVPTALASRAGSLWIAVALVSVAAAAHQGWSANIYTLASDMFPRRAVASVIGIGGFAGALGGWLAPAVRRPHAHGMARPGLRYRAHRALGRGGRHGQENRQRQRAQGPRRTTPERRRPDDGGHLRGLRAHLGMEGDARGEQRR